MRAQEKVFERLDSLGIQYQVMNHPAVYTIEEMDNLGISEHGDVCKNLFLRDAKGTRHFLVVLLKDKKADIKNIQKQLGCTNLSFASEERLSKHLQLQKGEVTPLGIINDASGTVELVLDKDLKGREKLGVHPNDNTATVWISFDDLKKVIDHNGNKIHYVTI